jgi:hypothetical protein
VSGRPTTTPATTRKKDPCLEEAIGDLRARAARLRDGRILVVLEVRDGQVARRRVEESEMATEDYDRLMRERPWPRGAKEGRDR